VQISARAALREAGGAIPPAYSPDGNDTALCFVLRAVNRILSDDDQQDRTTINRLWDVLDEPELSLIASWVLNRALGIKQNSRMILRP
jgi:hypothetical protein